MSSARVFSVLKSCMDTIADTSYASGACIATDPDVTGKCVFEALTAVSAHSVCIDLLDELEKQSINSITPDSDINTEVENRPSNKM